MPRVVTPEQKKALVRLVDGGWTVKAAAQKAGVSESFAKAHIRGLRDSSGEAWRASRQEEKLSGPKRRDELCPEALRALDDFEYFRLRYMGHLSTPWQVETANLVVELMASPHKEYVVENCPPGVGKTTLAHDIACWVTVRDRRIRGLFGSRIENNARRQMRRVRRTLERTSPARARSELVDRGLARDAEACLAEDFGTFRPQSLEVWKADEFVVAQIGDEQIEEKEPTWSSYGMNSGQLGNRFDLIIWDDVVDRTTIRTWDAQQDQRSWWDDEAETRLEPHGLLWLVGQRLDQSDLYRYCLDKRVEPDDEDEGAEELEIGDQPRRYQHVCYKAHYEDRCTGVHKPSLVKPYPDGCLLDPYRLPWRELRAIKGTKPQTYIVSYQQEDGDPSSVLVKKEWIYGGTDPEDGSLAPGCWDRDRGLWEFPTGLLGPEFVVATVDPSPTKMWAVQLWSYWPEASNQIFLIDLERRAMPANELLDWNENQKVFYGLMEDWQARSEQLGHKITHWIVEINAAQRFLLAYDHVRRWMQQHAVSIVPHSTTSKKLDPEMGLSLLREPFKFGRIRLPGRSGEPAYTSLKLVEEVTRYDLVRGSISGTDDQIMAAWFLLAHLSNIAIVRPGGGSRVWRPSWMR